jgi:hypothetical protein
MALAITQLYYLDKKNDRIEVKIQTSKAVLARIELFPQPLEP